MRAKLRTAMREIDSAGGPVARLLAIAKRGRITLGTTTTTDLQAIAEHLREKETLLGQAMPDVDAITAATAIQPTTFNEDGTANFRLPATLGDSLADCLRRASQERR